jgi:mono/diheme cytochrome c family protein
MNGNRPSWILPFFLISAAAAAAAAFAALIFGGQPGHGIHSERIADVTINLGGKPIREHCLTCHFQGGRAYEEISHPDIAPHSWVSLGCTACHLGQGMALDERISHGIGGRDARRVLRGGEIEASCFTCHDVSPMPGAQRAWSGYRLFIENACGACHTISAADIGGLYGPPLHAIGTYLGLAQLREAIREPRKSPPNSIMPRFALSEEEVNRIALFLKSRVAKPFNATPMALRAGWVRLPPVEMETPETIPEEDALLATRLCLACHRFGEEDGLIAPDLSWIGSMRSREFLGDFLANPATLIPGAIMPRMGMSREEETRLVRFLAVQAVGPVEGLHHDLHSALHELPPQAEAKHLYMTLCQRCHAASGDGFGIIQPNLADFPRAFSGNAPFFRSVSDERLLKSLKEGIAGTSMPPYGRLLEEEERHELLDLVFSAFVRIPREEKITPAPLPDPLEAVAFDVDTERLYADLCLRCHGRGGRGKGPEHLQYLPLPRNLANRPYFSTLEDERIARAVANGVPGTAMPAFHGKLTPWELWMMVEKVRRFTGGDDERTARPRAPSISD